MRSCQQPITALRDRAPHSLQLAGRRLVPGTDLALLQPLGAVHELRSVPALSGVDETGAVVNDGQTSTVSPDLQPGAYTLYRFVAANREARMEGTLVGR